MAEACRCSCATAPGPSLSRCRDPHRKARGCECSGGDPVERMMHRGADHLGLVGKVDAEERSAQRPDRHIADLLRQINFAAVDPAPRNLRCCSDDGFGHAVDALLAENWLHRSPAGQPLRVRQVEQVTAEQLAQFDKHGKAAAVDIGVAVAQEVPRTDG